MTKQVQNYFMGQWQDFSGEGILQRNAVNGSEISVVNGHEVYRLLIYWTMVVVSETKHFVR